MSWLEDLDRLNGENLELGRVLTIEREEEDDDYGPVDGSSRHKVGRSAASHRATISVDLHTAKVLQLLFEHRAELIRAMKVAERLRLPDPRGPDAYTRD